MAKDGPAQALPQGSVIDAPALRGRTRVFLDRADAGAALADLLAGVLADRGVGADRRGAARAVVLAIPAGGVPVAAEVAARLGLPIDVAVVSKITLPWDSESGYGAVAFDGTVRLNQPLRARLGLLDGEVAEGVERTRRKVEARRTALRPPAGPTDLRGRTAILVDDGLASGFTMRVAVEAVRRAGAVRVVVAVPTGHEDAARTIAADADLVVCANLRAGGRFAVADAYRRWSDVADAEAGGILAEAWGRAGAAAGA